MIHQGPVAIYKVVEEYSQLLLIPDEVGFPTVDDNEDNPFDQTVLPNVVVYVKNVTELEGYRYRGAYFRYNYVTYGWDEVAIGTHTHENKDIIDKITSGEIGTWTDLTNYPSVLRGTGGLIENRPLIANL